MQKLHENSKYAPMNESQYEWIYNQELHWQNYCIVQFFFYTKCTKRVLSHKRCDSLSMTSI